MPPKTRTGQRSYSKPTKSQKLNTMARKKDERAIRAAQKKEKQAQKYLPNDVSVASFLIQLHKLGLQLRNIPGDGNCLFRALGDQLDGHGRGHRKHRHDVVTFMSEHRGDFEPFVEDDVPFDRHVECLSCPGTYAGNDAIVAFARLHQLTVVIHQLNSPIWEIHGCDKPNSKQVHISYHNGDHYSSVRRLDDDSELPANIRFVNGAVLQNEKVVVQGSKQNGQKYSSTSSPDDGYDVNGYDDYAGSDTDDPTPVSRKVTDPELLAVIENIRHVTKCSDTKLITDLLEDNAFDFESTIASILQIMSGSSGNSSGQQTSSDSDTPSTPVGASPACVNGEGGAEAVNGCDGFAPKNHMATAYDHGAAIGAIPKSKQKTERKKIRMERKREKKARAEERHRQKFLGPTSADASKTISSDDDDIHTVINETLKVLQI